MEEEEDACGELNGRTHLARGEGRLQQQQPRAVGRERGRGEETKPDSKDALSKKGKKEGGGLGTCCERGKEGRERLLLRRELHAGF